MDMSTIIISVVGFCITFLLGINAYLIRDLVEKINAIGTSVAVAVTESGHLKSRIDNCEARLNNQDNGNNLFRESLHNFRNDIGNRIQVLEIKFDEFKK